MILGRSCISSTIFDRIPGSFMRLDCRPYIQRAMVGLNFRFLSNISPPKLTLQLM